MSRGGRSASVRSAAAVPAGMLAVAAALLCAACGRPAAIDSPAPAASASGVGTFVDVPVPAAAMTAQLRDQTGRAVTLASLHGTTLVVADFLSTCQEICPLTSANLRTVDDVLRRAGLTNRVRILEVTVDPGRDSPARLHAYQALFGSRANWSFLTGSPERVARFWAALGVAYRPVPEPPGPAPRDWLTGQSLTYDVEHQDVVLIIDADGHERWLVEGTPRLPPGSDVPAPAKHLLNADAQESATATNGSADPTWTPDDVTSALARVLGTD